MPETWRSIPGFPNYEVSSEGRVRRVTRYVLPQHNTRYAQNKLVNGAIDNGYRHVNLRDANGRLRKCYVHRLVCAAFNGIDPVRPHVNHKDCVRSNNRPENLEWCTQGENVRHALASGRIPLGSRIKNSKLNEDIVRKIRTTWLQSGKTQADLCREYGVTSATMCVMLQGKTWRHVNA